MYALIRTMASCVLSAAGRVKLSCGPLTIQVGFLSQIRAICLADDQEAPCSMRDGTWPVGEM